MLSILGVGNALPQTKLDNGTLAELSGSSAADIHKRTGIENRYSSLNSEYLKITKNRNLSDGEKNALVSATDLAVAATRSALQVADLSAEQIGLIVADNIAPTQTTPSEAQRLGDALKLKIPAYDITSGFDSFFTHLENLFNRKNKNLPNITLSVCTETITQRINYSAGDERFYFGDGAGAALLSHQSQGRINVLGVFGSSKAEPPIVRVGTYTHAQFQKSSFPKEFQASCITQLRKAVSEVREQYKRLFVAAPEVDGAVSAKFAAELSLKNSEHMILAKECGCLLGAWPYHVLAKNWNRFQAGDGIMLVSSFWHPRYALLHVVA